ncbi:MAG: hypothetical protein II888_03220 [Clostridia bacterium]|nr:hypothetical protein [Clostridia bacterium]
MRTNSLVNAPGGEKARKTGGSLTRRAFLLLLLLICFRGMTVSGAENADRQNLVFYEIFTGSFSDSNGDGIGDLPGILNRLDYLNDGKEASETSLGIQGIWLTPVFSSPSYHKYDVADYLTIDSQFGSMEDLRNLIEACQARGIRLILDLPLNHTSSTHPWFRKFLSARTLHNDRSEYYDYYICHETGSLPAGHSCYAIPGTDFWYEANFSRNMPELNYDNEAVRREILEIARFYLEMGVDGFRFDAAKYIYYGDHGRSSAFWDWYTGELRALCPDIWLVAEVWDGDAVTDLYFPAMNCFDFTVSQPGGLIAETAAGGDVNRYTAYVEQYLERIHGLRESASLVPFISNHDMDRAAGYLPDSNGRIRMAANLYILGPGAPFIYYGEEIGLRGSRGGANTDANRRLAMRWGDGDTVSDPEGADYTKQTDATVASMMEQSYSLLHYYRRLIDIRNQHPEIAGGIYRALNLKDTKAGGFIAGEDSTVLVLHNPAGKAVTLNLAEQNLQEYQVLSAQIGMGFAALEGNILTLDGQTSAVLRRAE